MQYNHLISNGQKLNTCILIKFTSTTSPQQIRSLLNILEIICYDRFILIYENKFQIFHCNRGKIQRMPSLLTSFTYQMAGCLDGIIQIKRTQLQVTLVITGNWTIWTKSLTYMAPQAEMEVFIAKTLWWNANLRFTNE